MKEEIDFSKYDDKYFLCIEENIMEHKITIYHLMMEKDWWHNTEYKPILLLYSCNILGADCIVHQREIPQKKFLPEFNSNVKEISKEIFDQIKTQIENLSVEESALKANKFRFYLECKKLW